MSEIFFNTPTFKEVKPVIPKSSYDIQGLSLDQLVLLKEILSNCSGDIGSSGLYFSLCDFIDEVMPDTYQMPYSIAILSDGRIQVDCKYSDCIKHTK